ncbi:MAG: hypothetical protein QM784_00785 [Polyangiaceae bacterium]
MTLQLEQHSDLIARIRRGDDAPMGAVTELIRASYPELFRQIASVLGRGQESVSIEPGDVVLIKIGYVRHASRKAHSSTHRAPRRGRS